MGQIKDCAKWATSYEAPGYVSLAVCVVIWLLFMSYLFIAVALLTYGNIFVATGFLLFVPLYAIWMAWRNK